MITVYHWNKDSGGKWGGAEALEEARASTSVWIDLEAPTEEEERQVFQQFYTIHPLSLEDMTRPRRLPDDPPHLPKVEEFPDYLLVIVNPLRTTLRAQVNEDERPTTEGGCATQLSVLMTEHVLVTHHYEPLISTAELRGYLQRHDAEGARGPDYLFHVVLDVMVDQYAPVLDDIDDLVDNYEEEALTKPRPMLLRRLLELKRTVIALRKSLVHEREVLARLSRGEFRLIEPREMAYYRNVYDHLVRFTELIETAREALTDLTQTLLAATSNKLNQIVKVLTMISTTILPMSLIAGIYGMNFDQGVWPASTKDFWGFLGSLGLMALSALGAVGLFRWMKWI